MKAYKMPYVNRIMGRLTVAGVVHESVEFARYTRPMQPKDWNHITSERAPEWEFWVETRTREHWLLGGSRLIPERAAVADLEQPDEIELSEQEQEVIRERVQDQPKHWDKQPDLSCA